MPKVEPVINESDQSGSYGVHEQLLSSTPIDRILQKVSSMELPAKEHFERYLRHKVRLNHKPRTLASSFTSVRLFLDFGPGRLIADPGRVPFARVYPPGGT